MKEIEKLNIEKLIYEIRGKQVMLDSDLARLYGCKNGTKSINLAVKRHINRFPERFMFQLTEEELIDLRFQIETANNKSRVLPYVFTEQGVAMLSAVLKTVVAEEISVKIMDAFVAMKKYLSSNLLEQKYINNQVMKNTEDIKLLQESFKQFDKKKEINDIFFEGEIYDAYSVLLDIFDTSKESITIIDNYADKKLLDLLSKTNKKITIYSKNMNKELIKKYQSQYNNVTLIENNSFHDRFIIIDNKYLYHSGASFKELGKKCFAISKVTDKKWLEKINEYLSND